MTLRAEPVQSTDETCSADSVSPSPKVLASIDDYPSMLFAMRARAAEREIAISSDHAAHVAGLSDRRLSQILSLRTLRNIQSVRRIGVVSLGPVLGLLGVRLLMVENEEAIRRFGSRLKLRNSNLAHSGVVQHTQSIKFLRAIGKKGGRARMDQLRASRRLAAHQRKAGKARWRKPKVAQRHRKDAAATAAKSAQ
jgi:hypothetical protein